MRESRELISTRSAGREELEPRWQSPSYYPSYKSFSEGSAKIFEYWNAIRKRLWLIVGLVVLVTTLTAIYVARQPNVYEARARVQVDLEQGNPQLQVSDRPTLLPNPDPAYFNTQLQLLTSDSLLRRVVKEMNLETNKEFQEERNRQQASTWRAILRSIGLAREETKKTRDLEEVLAGMNLATAEEINEAVRLAPFVEILKKNLRVDPVRVSQATFKDTRLIEISFQHTNPELAALIVNGIAEVFVKQNQEKRTGTNKRTNDFLAERIATLQSEIKRDEMRLAELKNNAGILKKDEGQTIVIDRLAGLNKQLLEAENIRKIAEAEYMAVKDSPEKLRALAEEKLQRFITERENDMRSLNNETAKKIAELEAEKAKLLIEYQESAIEVQEINRKMEALKSTVEKAQEKNREELEKYRARTAKEILTNLQTRYEQAKAQEDKIRRAFEEQYRKAEGENRAAIDIKLLEQNIETNRGFLKNLIEQQSSNDVVAQGTTNNISVVDLAIPPDTPVSPRRLLTVMMALFLSTCFGVGLAFFLEYLDDTIKTAEDVENYLGLPVLVVIPSMNAAQKRRLLLVGSSDNEPAFKNRSELLIYDNSRSSSLSEAYRQLRTSILLSVAGHAPKSLLVTSSLPAEGKTTTAVNTAITLAQTGAKVLVIDADMRRPRIHSIFNISNREGLSNLLSSEIKRDKVLDSVYFDMSSRLYLLPSGPVPPNPAELIGSTQMSTLMEIFQKEFTHVIIDSPPIASFTDGVLIAAMVDGVIMVVHSAKTSRQIVRRSCQLIQDVGAKIFGVLLNNVNLSSQDNYYYYQSYYYNSYYKKEEEEE
ncbi:MAG: polysaccharide biosynthesis tyrosine autokinase [Acidobacteria bacterium]|nr:MAG: polysaccharide biosynthesis tyrosine autokinase [Acidobacteriota bacterium]